MKVVFSTIFLCLLSSLTVFSQTDKTPDYIKLLSEYVKIPSEQYQEKKAGVFFMEECRKKGLCTEVLSANDSAFNFVASIYPLDLQKPNIIFLNHIDVVPPGDASLWTHDPYSGLIKDSSVWGRGSMDIKGMAVAQLFATASFVDSANKQFPYNVSILCVSGEETDSHNGAELIANKHFEKLNPYMIFGEGGSGTNGVINAAPEKIVFGVSSVEKSKIILQLDMEINASGHGSIPPKEYAVKELVFALEKILKKKPELRYNKTSVKALKTLGKYEMGLKGFAQRHFTFLVFTPFVKKEIINNPLILPFFANTITLTHLIVPEGTNNMICTKATAIFDCRLLPGVNTDRFIKNVHNWIKDPRVKITIKEEVVAAKKTEDETSFKLLEKAIHQVYPDAVVLDILTPVTTDNNFFRSKGVPSYGIFPAAFTKQELASVHSINEHIHFDRMESSIEVYENLLEYLLSYERKKKKFRIFKKIHSTTPKPEVIKTN